MDAVVKVGGSLVAEPSHLINLCTSLSKLSRKHTIVVVPGGGRFADVVRDCDERFNLSRNISHRMAILGMDQFGMLLSQITPNSVATYLLNDTKQLSETSAVPIFLPSRLMFGEDPLENSWDVTSDSIAAYVANRLEAHKLLLITDVDGIFTKNPRYKDSMLIEQISAEELSKFSNRTSVDNFLAKLLLEIPVNCYVVNGKYPDRVRAIIEKKQTICTFISTKAE